MCSYTSCGDTKFPSGDVPVPGGSPTLAGARHACPCPQKDPNHPPTPAPGTLRTLGRPTVGPKTPGVFQSLWEVSTEPGGGSLSLPRSLQPAAPGRRHIHMVISACEPRRPLQQHSSEEEEEEAAAEGGSLAFPGPRSLTEE